MTDLRLFCCTTLSRDRLQYFPVAAANEKSALSFASQKVAADQMGILVGLVSYDANRLQGQLMQKFALENDIQVPA